MQCGDSVPSSAHQVPSSNCGMDCLVSSTKILCTCNNVILNHILPDQKDASHPGEKCGSSWHIGIFDVSCSGAPEKPPVAPAPSPYLVT